MDATGQLGFPLQSEADKTVIRLGSYLHLTALGTIICPRSVLLQSNNMLAQFGTLEDCIYRGPVNSVCVE